MAETWNKKERERKKQAKKKEKNEKKQERKENSKSGHDLDDMLAYIDENGDLSSKPPDPRKKITINAEDMNISGVPKQVEVDPADLIHSGIVMSFNNDKGYGFIKDMKTQQSVFVHVKSLEEPVKPNNKVSFEIEMGPKGANAVNVKLIR
jgi:cold shock CspA family protein